jgi:hypothetical protein
MVEEYKSTKKSKLPLFAVVGIGCFLIIALSLIAFSIAFAVAGKFIFSPLGENFLRKSIENAIGIKLENGKNGERIAITNTKTGESIEVSEGKIPENFPKDFPLYPQAKPSGSAIGSEKMMGKGFWLLLESHDSISDVTGFYNTQLEAKGWIVEETNALGDGSSYKIKKEKLTGTVIVSKNSKENVTTILITLEPTNEKNPAPLDVSEEGSVPQELPQY